MPMKKFIDIYHPKHKRKVARYTGSLFLLQFIPRVSHTSKRIVTQYIMEWAACFNIVLQCDYCQEGDF